jgi:Ser/Thr protein kinase RdoA (MazF antagonist)
MGYNYRVGTRDGPVMLRVFRHSGFPREEKTRFIETTLERIGLRHARTLYVTSANPHFHNGFQVSEWLEGPNGDEALETGAVSPDDFYRELGAMLRTVHEVRLDAFGIPPFEREGDVFPDWAASVLDWDVARSLPRMVTEGGVSAELVSRAVRLLEQLVRETDFPVEPVLVHADPNPENVIWTAAGPVLIDWDNAISTSCAYDLAWLTYWNGERVREPFLRGYGPIGLETDHWMRLERVFHLRLALEMLPFYAYAVPDPAAVAFTAQRLSRLLSAGES